GHLAARENRVLLHHTSRAQHLLNCSDQPLGVFQHHLVELAALLLVQVALLQRLQIQPDGSDRRFQLVGHCIQEAVLLLVAPDLAHQKDGIEYDARDNKAEEDNAENQRNDFAPVKDDPTDVEHHRRRGQTDAQRDKERNGGLAAGDAHGDEVRIALEQLPVVSCRECQLATGYCLLLMTWPLALLPELLPACQLLAGPAREVDTPAARAES